MLDQMSGGRIITGFVRGIGTEYFASGVNPTHSHGALLRGARADPARLDRDRPVPLSRPALSVRLRQSVAAAAAAAASAGLDSLAGQLRDGRMVRVGQAQIHLPADLQPGEVGPEGVRSLPPGGRARGLRVAALAARLGDPDLCRRDRRDRAARAQAAHRGVLQQVPALSARDANAAGLFVDRLDQVADGEQVRLPHDGDDRRESHRARHGGRRQRRHRARAARRCRAISASAISSPCCRSRPFRPI